MRKICAVALVAILIAANISVDIAYSTLVIGNGNWQKATTYVELPNGETVCVRDGEVLEIDGYVPVIANFRAESGWHRVPIEPKWKVSISLRKFEAGRPELFLSSLMAAGRRTKVMLFSPELLERTYPGRPPLYYLSSVLRQKGYEVLTVDVDISGRQRFIECLREFQPAVIGGTSLSIQINESMALMELARKHCPGAVTVLGGNHATAAGEHLFPIHASYLDAVAVGEGLTTIELVTSAAERGKWESEKSGIPGLLLWDGNQIVWTSPAAAENPNRFLPELPYHPSYDFAVFHRENGRPRKTFQIMTAFGCENACFFCHSSTNLRGEERRVERRMSIDTVRMILQNAAAEGYEAVYFDDDTFTRDRNHALAVARLCRELGLVFGCHTRPDCEDEELIREFADDGCVYMFSGLETAVPEILRGANKTRDPERYREAYANSFRLKNKAGIPDSTFMIHGMPRLVKEDGAIRYDFDTIEDSRRSIEFAVRELDPTYLSMNVLRFLPNVPFSFGSQFQFLRPVEGILHGGYWDRKWLEVNGKSDPRCFHPILRAFEGSGSSIPRHMTPKRCYEILKIAVKTVNRKNGEPDRNQTRIVVDPWFESRYLKAVWVSGVLSYELAPFDLIT